MQVHTGDCIEDLGPCRGFWQFPMERYCGMLIPLISSRKLPYVNLINNVLLQESNAMQLYSKKNARDIRDIEESYMNSRNDYCVAVRN
ncbi:transposase domain-containing protein [Rhizophagus irregularis DAOM 181602=DAOM 197198]|nr:transposase domain-containing protein [Rhizophagus irregularis DAOM 181602=DAOM 197198]